MGFGERFTSGVGADVSRGLSVATSDMVGVGTSSMGSAFVRLDQGQSNTPFHSGNPTITAGAMATRRDHTSPNCHRICETEGR